ncbi:3-(3-hydroxy-phenyl)propionate transporter MhpT [Caulobacter vibrioides]|uniref:3-(3-hydroxy-phenyl)propionate transporter MhpT n=1 Tax=Caulobacter vibrioides TaxID=155892 RepID=UPI000BB523DB|nr:3-(3-hydroxy-phenyl)propionate transporter MhpT [Caulobacter vibrioides]ATC25404.1 3-(3-hydroxy-phenyl)propionate transporter MhpT [Caulobacter vibrioides]AZH13496.1 3-(3-hydroxy-phenyl)propionate transporter MhpT [Caulobacter vibrioides]PLR14363.1 3-(3-hydroxy-phenyl)propionate transporter MhpT [Caulobacter vibrioides]
MTTKGRSAPGTHGGLVAVAICCLLAVFEGFDLQAAGVAAPRLAPDLGLKPEDLGWFFSISTFGLMVGAALGGRLSDRFGRKVTLLVSVAAFGLLSIATGLAQDLNGLLVARFLTGVGLGGALPNLIAIVAESVSPKLRGRAVGFLYAGLPCGGALASLVSLAGADPSDWRIVFFVGGVGPLLAMLLAMVLLPDTPMAQVGPVGDQKSGFVEALAGEGRGLTTLLLWIAFFLALLIMYLLLSWLPSLMIGRGLSRSDAGLIQMAFNLAGAAGSVATGWLMDHRRWRTLTILGAFGASAAAMATAAAAPASLAVFLIVGAALGATVSGVQSVVYGLAPGFYPARLRGTGVGAAVVVGRLGSAAGPLLAATLIGAGGSSNQVLLALMPVIALGGLVSLLLATRPHSED